MATDDQGATTTVAKDVWQEIAELRALVADLTETVEQITGILGTLTDIVHLQRIRINLVEGKINAK